MCAIDRLQNVYHSVYQKGPDQRYATYLAIRLVHNERMLRMWQPPHESAAAVWLPRLVLFYPPLCELDFVHLRTHEKCLFRSPTLGCSLFWLAASSTWCQRSKVHDMIQHVLNDRNHLSRTSGGAQCCISSSAHMADQGSGRSV